MRMASAMQRSFQKAFDEQQNRPVLVHQNTGAYRSNRSILRYCGIVTFQGFCHGEFAPGGGRKSAPKRCALGWVQLEVLGEGKPPAIVHRGVGCRAVQKAQKLRLVRDVVASRQDVIAIRPVLRRRLLKGFQRRGPKFHPIEIVVQTIQRLDEVLHNGIWRGVRHNHSIPNLQSKSLVQISSR